MVVFVVIQAGVPENAAVDPCAQRIEDLGCHAEFHVGDPHTDKFFIFEGKHFFRAGVKNIAAKTIRVQRIGMATVNDFIEIVVHNVFPFFAFAAGTSGCAFIIANVLENKQQISREKALCARPSAHIVLQKSFNFILS